MIGPLRKVPLVLVLVAVSICSNAADLPLRKDCIVEIELGWEEAASLSAKAATIEAMAANLRERYASSRMEPNLSFKEGLDQIYAQFKSFCEDRLQQAEELMEALTRGVVGAPSYEVSSRRISPGPDTIDSWGPFWRDRSDN